MAEIEAFQGWRYANGNAADLSALTAPPYDVISPSLQDALYARHEHNVVRLILNRAEAGDDDDAKYNRAAALWRKWKHDGVVARDPVPTLYVYHQQFEHAGLRYTRKGILCRMRLETLGERSVFPHEATHAGPKADRLKLTRACQANLSPIFGLWPDDDNRVIQTTAAAVAAASPCHAIDEAGVLHQIWSVRDPSVLGAIQKIAAALPVFIADGHHRYETALNYRNELESLGPLPNDHPARFVMIALFSMSDPGLVVLPTHRLFRGVPPLTSRELATRLASSFQVTKVASGPDSAGEVWQMISQKGEQSTLGLYTQSDQSWMLAELTDAGRARMAAISKQSGSWNDLGVSLLHELVIGDCLKLKGLPSPLYVRGEDEVSRHLKEGDSVGRDQTGQAATGEPFQLAALVMPASVDHVAVISRRGERMPAKSTYFFPKLLSGLVFHSLEERGD